MGAGKVTLVTSIATGSGQFEVCENDTLVVSGRIYAGSGGVRATTDNDDDELDEPVTPEVSALPLNTGDVYKELRLRGYDYGPTFQGIVSADGYGALINTT